MYKPLFSTSHNKTYIEVLNFTGGDMYYDDSLETYDQGYNPACVQQLILQTYMLI